MGTVTRQTMEGGGGDFTPCPKGIYQAVLCDVVDLGWEEKMYNGESQGRKPFIQLVFQVNKMREEDGKPYLIFGRRSVLSFDDRSNFYNNLAGLVGQEELEGLLAKDEWDTDDLIGTNCRMQVVHNESKDGSKVYANIAALFPWMAGDGDMLIIQDYVRRQDRPGYQAPYPSCFDNAGANYHGEEDYSNGNAHSNGQQSASEATQSADNSNAPQSITKDQKTLLVREAERVKGTEGVAFVKGQLGNVNESSYRDAEELLTWLKKQPDLPKPFVEEEDGDDPFGD